MRLLIILILLPFIVNAQTYKAIYNINFISNLNTRAVRTERAFLIIKNNQESSYASENTYKQDSIRRLVKEGVLTAQEVMNDSHPKTGLNHFVQKNYSGQSMTIANLIALDNYIYNQKNELFW
jgi:GLPGLI family protein